MSLPWRLLPLNAGGLPMMNAWGRSWGRMVVKNSSKLAQILVSA